MSLKRKRRMTLLTIVGLTAVLLITTGWNVMADIEPAPVLVPGGVYTGVHPPPLVYTFTRTVIPTDPAGNTMTFIYRCDNAYPTLGDPNPPLSETDHMTDFVGDMVRTGPNTWEGTAVAYGTKKVEAQPNPEMVYIAVFQGTLTYTDNGNSEVSEGMFALFLPQQDADGDGFPDEDQMPVYCGPSATVASKRMPMVPPCVPAPPPEGQ